MGLARVKVAPLFLIAVVGCTASRAQFGNSAGRNIERARHDDLNGREHRLAFYAFEPTRGPPGYYHLGRGMVATDEPLASVAVGATVVVQIPRKLGTGHGPFRQVYAEKATPKVLVADGLTLSSAPRFDDGVLVKCERAGVFEVSVVVHDQDGEALHDGRSIECLVPTRFEASSKGRYIANGGSIYVGCTWFGKRADGLEVKLMGLLPVEVSPGEMSISLLQPVDFIGARFRPLRATTGPAITSAGFTARLPIEIIDSNWKLEVSFQETGLYLWVTAYGLDDKGEKLGLDACALEARSGEVVTGRGNRCQFAMRRNNGEPLKGGVRDWTADEICVSSVGQTVCKPVPR